MVSMSKIVINHFATLLIRHFAINFWLFNSKKSLAVNLVYALHICFHWLWQQIEPLNLDHKEPKY